MYQLKYCRWNPQHAIHITSAHVIQWNMILLSRLIGVLWIWAVPKLKASEMDLYSMCCMSGLAYSTQGPALSPDLETCSFLPFLFKPKSLAWPRLYNHVKPDPASQETAHSTKIHTSHKNILNCHYILIFVCKMCCGEGRAAVSHAGGRGEAVKVTSKGMTVASGCEGINHIN